MLRLKDSVNAMSQRAHSFNFYLLLQHRCQTLELGVSNLYLEWQVGMNDDDLEMTERRRHWKESGMECFER